MIENCVYCIWSCKNWSPCWQRHKSARCCEKRESAVKVRYVLGTLKDPHRRHTCHTLTQRDCAKVELAILSAANGLDNTNGYRSCGLVFRAPNCTEYNGAPSSLDSRLSGQIAGRTALNPSGTNLCTFVFCILSNCSDTQKSLSKKLSLYLFKGFNNLVCYGIKPRSLECSCPPKIQTHSFGFFAAKPAKHT